MPTLKQQLFQQSAAERVKRLVAEYKKRYEPKKEDRFHFDGITYEFGPPVAAQGGIEFEISSKIPHEEFVDAEFRKRYFSEVRKIMMKGERRPIAIDMENIIRELGSDEVKAREYVKLRYLYKDSELYDEEEVRRQADEYRKPGSKKTPPKYNGINTLEGNLLVDAVAEKICEQARLTMDALVAANQDVRVSLGKLRSSKSGKEKAATSASAG